MHELSIALELVDFAAERAEALGAVEVTGVHVRVGALAGVVKDALEFSFDVASAGTPLDGARLIVDDVAAVAWCASCDAERELTSLAIRRCEICGSPMPRLVRGTELEVTGLEIRTA